MQNQNFFDRSTSGDQILTHEEEFELAGYRPDAVELIDREYLIGREEETKEQPSSSENPLIRFAVMATLVGGVMSIGLLFWMMFFAPKPIPPRAANPAPPAPSPFESDETSQLKAQLAFRDQASRLEKPPVVPQQPVIRATTPAPPQVVRVAAPPRIIRQTVPVAAALPPQVFSRPTPVQQPTVDPFERWNQIATVGQQRAKASAFQPPVMTATATSNAPVTTPATHSFAASAPVATTMTDSFAADNAPVAYTSPLPQKSAIGVVSLGGDELDGATQSQSSEYSAGERGILSRTATATADAKPMQVRLGTSAAAKVTVPMIWSGGDRNSQPSQGQVNAGRFAVELSQDVLAADGRVALPKGTVLITEVDAVTSNRMVYQSVVAVIYTTRTGEMRQQTIPKNSILIRGRDNLPLIAQKLRSKGSKTAKQNIMAGLLSAVSKVSELANRPRNQSSSVITSGGFSQVISNTSNPKPNLLAAAAEGFFGTTAKRFSQRAEQNAQEILAQPDVLVVPPQTSVSVFFNTFFQVVP